MDIPSEADALGGVLAGALVKLMVTEGWNTTRDWLSNIFQRHRGKPAERDTARLDSAHNALAAAPESDRESVGGKLEAEWSVRLGDFLADHPDAIADVQKFLGEHSDVAKKSMIGHNITINARADRKARQNITGIGNIGVDPRK
jgi:hypothetical protein